MTQDYLDILNEVKECIACLVKIDPDPDSPEGRLLTGLTFAVADYEDEVDD